MTTSATITGDLRLGHILAAAGLELSDVVLLRHTFTKGGLESPSDLTADKVMDYTRRQDINNKLGRTPPRFWLIFIADGSRRSRFLTAYENHGEVPAELTETLRYFDLRPSEVLSSLVGRLVVEWSRDPVNWAKTAATASTFPVIEIADPEVVPFPGFDRVLITHAVLQSVVQDSRYAAWQTALGAVQGISSPTPAPASSTWARPTGANASSDAGPPTPETAMAATSRCGIWPAAIPPTRATSCSVSCGSSGRACRRPRSTKQSRTSNGRCSLASTGSTATSDPTFRSRGCRPPPGRSRRLGAMVCLLLW